MWQAFAYQANWFLSTKRRFSTVQFCGFRKTAEVFLDFSLYFYINYAKFIWLLIGDLYSFIKQISFGLCVVISIVMSWEILISFAGGKIWWVLQETYFISLSSTHQHVINLTVYRPYVSFTSIYLIQIIPMESEILSTKLFVSFL